MKKTKNNAEVRKTDAKTDVNNEGLYKKKHNVEPWGNKKSPKVEQSNKISSWLEKRIVKKEFQASSTSTEQNGKEINKFKLKEYTGVFINSSCEEPNSDYISGEMKANSSKQSDLINTTPTKQKKKSEVNVSPRRSPRNKKHLQFNLDQKVDEESCDNVTRKGDGKNTMSDYISDKAEAQQSDVNTTPVEQKKKNEGNVSPRNKEPSGECQLNQEVDEASCSSITRKEDNKDKMCKRKVDGCTSDNVGSYRKRRKLNSESSKKNTQHHIVKNFEESSNPKNGTESSIDKYKKSDKDKVKTKKDHSIMKEKSTLHGKENSKRTDYKSRKEIPTKCENLKNGHKPKHISQQKDSCSKDNLEEINTTPVKKNVSDGPLRRSPRHRESSKSPRDHKTDVSSMNKESSMSPVNKSVCRNIGKTFNNNSRESDREKQLNNPPTKCRQKNSTAVGSPKRRLRSTKSRTVKEFDFAEKLFTKPGVSQNSTINKWLSKHEKKKDDVSEIGRDRSPSKETHKSKASVKKESESKARKNIELHKEQKYRSRISRKKENASTKKSNIENSIKNKVDKKQDNLDTFVNKLIKKDSKQTKFVRTESSESCEFPSFRNAKKKSKTNKSCESFKKYGVILPTLAEILQEQKDLREYKKQIESLQQMELPSFELPFSVADLNRTETNCTKILDCKHLTMDEITEAFRNNLTYISDIFNGKKNNDRHNRFFDNKNKSYTLTTNDLTYSTSMVVFNYEQMEHMLSLLQDEFDPDDKWTSYFFQILLPELCLKIFMDVHEMTNEDAIKYLDIRPID